ncbi:MAG: metallophosphoesterase [Fuerstiella sp.]|nr:metallophosphoesterase [Fuerstiella sp.]
MIGDIHGYADELVQLLEMLGYTETGGCFRNPTHRVVFCGDFIDRGPQIRDTVNIVRNMVRYESAYAAMGNHEFNAIAYHTRHPEQPDNWCRPHSVRNTIQHQATLDQLNEQELSETLDWFRELPIAVDLGVVRVVHACWDVSQISLLEKALSEKDRFNASFVAEAADPNHPVGEAIERVLKGPEVLLPDGMTVTDREGQTRRRVRVRWFDSPDEHSLGSYVFPDVPGLRNLPVPTKAGSNPYPSDAPPLFIGHYWLNDGQELMLRPNLACLDLSVAKQGMLCAYRFNGESVLNRNSFFKVPARDNAFYES